MVHSRGVHIIRYSEIFVSESSHSGQKGQNDY